MKKLYQYISLLLLSSGLCGACHDDMGNYDYQDINEITVKIPEQVTIKIPESDSVLVEVVPEISQLEREDEGNLSFEWRIEQAKESSKWEIYSQEKALRFYVKPETQNTYFRLGVTDVNLGITSYQQVLVRMVKPFEDTWFILQNSLGKAVLATIDGTGENSVVTKDIYDAKYHGEYQLQGAPLSVNYCFYQEHNSSTDWRLEVLTAQGGSLYEVKNLSKPVYDYSELLFEATLRQGWSFKPEYAYSYDLGNLIIDNGRLWYAYGNGYFVYFPLQLASGLETDCKITCAMPFYISGSLHDYMIAFDEVHKRFLYCNPPYPEGVEGLLRMSAAQADWELFYSMLEGTAKLTKVPDYSAHPNVFSPEIGDDKSLLYMGNWGPGNVVAFANSNRDGKLHVYEFSRSAVLNQDTALCLNHMSCEIAGNMEDISIAISTSYRNIFFYSQGNCVYRVDLNRVVPKVTVVYENPDATARIKKMKFRHPYRNTWVDNTDRKQRRDQPYWLGLAVQKGTEWSFVDLKLAISGEVEKDAEKNPMIYEYNGFDEIVDMTYCFPVR